MPAPARPQPGGLLTRVLDLWPRTEAYGRRLLPFTVLLVGAAVIIDRISPTSRPGFLLAGVAVALAAQALAAAARHFRAWVIVVPLAEMVAICLLDLGSGELSSGVVLLLFAPAVSLALVPGTGPFVAGVIGVAVAALVPPLLVEDRFYPVLNASIAWLVIVSVMAHVHTMVAQSFRRERQLAAARDLLRSIMAAATEQAIMATDATGRLVAVSGGAERLLEAPASRLVGTDVRELAEDPHGSGIEQLAVAAAEAGSHVFVRELIVGSARRTIEFVVTPRPPSDPDGPLDGYLVVATDVTEREEEQRRQEQFIGLVSHELRTPLVSILGYVDLLRLGPDGLTDHQREYVDVLARNASRLKRLVDDLLLSARVVADDPMVAQDVDAVAIVQESIASVRPMAEADGVSLVLSGDPSVPLVSDPQRLGQVVDNLLTNAVKYSRPGGEVRVAVVAEPGASGTTAARISVADDGTGIAPDELRRITEPFYRSRDTRRRRIAGVGLGLALVQTVVADHGGTLTIDSAPGRGTVVVVRLPDAVVDAPTG